MIQILSKSSPWKVRTYGNLNKPSGIAIGGDGYSFVSESDGSCVSISSIVVTVMGGGGGGGDHIGKPYFLKLQQSYTYIGTNLYMSII